MVSKHTICSSIALSSLGFGLLCAGCRKENNEQVAQPAQDPAPVTAVEPQAATVKAPATAAAPAMTGLKASQVLKDYRYKAGEKITVIGAPLFVSENRFGDQSFVWSKIPVRAEDGETALSVKSQWRLLEDRCLLMKGAVRQFQDGSGNIYFDIEEYDAPEGISAEVEDVKLKMSDLNSAAREIPPYSVQEAYTQAQSLNWKTIAIKGSPVNEKQGNGSFWYSLSENGVTLSVESKTRLPESVKWVVGWVQYDTGGGAPCIHVSYTDYAASGSSKQFRTRLPTEDDAGI